MFEASQTLTRDSVKIGFHLTVTFPCLNMFRVSAKTVVWQLKDLSDMSDGFLLTMPLSLWPMLLLVVGWITVWLELYQTLVDTPV